MSETTEPIRMTLGHQAIWLRQVVPNLLLVSAGYYVLAVVGTVLSVPASGVSIIWPATAFLISVLILTPARHWWLYLLSVVPGHLHTAHYFHSAELPLVVIVCQLIGNFSLAIATSLVVRITSTARSRLRPDSFQGLLSFILLAGLAVPAVVNALILGLQVWMGWATDFWLSWRQWMLAGVFPTITIPPLAVAAIRGRLVARGTNLWSSYVEVGFLSIALWVVCNLAFDWNRPQPDHLPIHLLAPLPLLLWAAVRLGVGGTCLALLAVAGALSTSALAGRGPFALSSPIGDVLSLQVFLITMSVPLLLLAALVEERIQTAASLRLSEQRLLTLQHEGQKRIAQELHDSSSQHLTAMALNLMVLESRVGPDANATIKDMRVSLKAAMRELQSIGYLLHPVQIHSDGLYSTLQGYVDGFAARTKLRAKFRSPRAIDQLPLPVQETMLRIVQESLANVYRHASASSVTVKLSRVGQRLHLVVADDGKGVRSNQLSDDGEPQSLGVGIHGMKARARELGGKLDIRNRPRGAIVHAVVPISRLKSAAGGL